VAAAWSTPPEGDPQVGYALTDKVRDAIAKVPTTAWKPAITSQGEPREHGDVVDITGMLDLTRWPTGMRVIVRREHPHPGAALSLFEHADGWRYHPSSAVDGHMRRAVWALLLVSAM